VAIRIRLACTAAALIPVAALAAACGSSTPSSASKPKPAPTATIPAAPSGGTLTETGSSVMFPLVNDWEAGYTKQYPGIKISTASTDSGTGISDAGQGLVNIGTADSYLSATDAAQYPSLENIPLGVDAIEVIYNLSGLSAPLNLNGTVLAQIYEGKITTWNNPAIAQLNPGVTLPSTTIVTVHRGDSSGSTVLFAQYLNAQDPTDWPATLISSTPTWPSAPGALAETGSGDVVSGVGATPGAIGYVGVSYASKIAAAKLSAAALENGAGKYVTATPAALTAAVDSFPAAPASGTEELINSKAAGGYPISGYEYAIVNTTQSTSKQADLIQNFLYWTITTGSSNTYLSQVGFVALPQATFTVAKTLITGISG
jgi:phosphate transport system substrate-binding protein